MIPKNILNKIYQYPESLSKKTRKELGIVYTPIEIVDRINNKLLSQCTIDNDFRVIDLSCGTGIFLVDMMYKIHEKTGESFEYIIENRLHGIDIDFNAVKILRDIFKDIAPNITCNVFCGNTLNKKFLNLDIDKKFRIVVGNPPYVKIQNITEEDQYYLKDWQFIAGNTDLYIPFYEAGLDLLDSNGVLGYISSNSFLKNKSGKPLLKYLLDNQMINEIIDFKEKQVFPDLSTYVSICLLSKQKQDFYKYSESDNKISFRYYNKTNVDNVAMFSDDVEALETLESYRKLGDLFDIRVGLATLADKVFFLGIPTEINEEYAIFGDIKIERKFLKKCVKASTLKEGYQYGYILFPYKNIDGKYCLLEEGEITGTFAYEYLKLHKERLEQRDKGKNKGYTWWEYGRSQGLSTLWKEKLVLAPLSKHPSFIYCADDVLYLSGYALMNKPGSNIDLKFIKIILESVVMQEYIERRSKKMGGGWNVYSKEFIKNFSIPEFTEEEVELIKNCDKNTLNSFLLHKYNVGDLLCSDGLKDYLQKNKIWS